jgi:hypothetical protein
VSNTAQSSRSVPREPKAASPVGRWNRHSLPVGADAGPDGPAIRFIPDLVLQRLDDFSPLGPHAVPKMTGEVDDPSVLDGEAFITAFGHVLGVYTWDANGVPSLARIQSVLARRATADCRCFRLRPRRTRLVGWHGGWTEEGIGIFAAEIYGLPKRRPGRKLGRVSLVVRPPGGREASVGHDIAC